MLNDQKRLLLELYKELGLEVRQRSSETYATNRLMLPPLVIGLLVLYGEVERFLGVEFKNPEDIHRLVWFGCVVISLLWICNMSRLAQLSHWHLDTQRECERELGLIGHRKVAKKDQKSEKDLFVLKILTHNKLRFVGFGIYFFLLLHYILESTVLHHTLILLIAIGLSIILAGAIWMLYFETLPRLSRKTSNLISFISIFLVLLALLIMFLMSPPAQLDADAYLMHGLKFSVKGNYDEAIKAYTKAIKINPDDVSAHALRSEAYRAKNKNQESKANWDKANKLRKAQ